MAICGQLTVGLPDQCKDALGGIKNRIYIGTLPDVEAVSYGVDVNGIITGDTVGLSAYTFSILKDSATYTQVGTPQPGGGQEYVETLTLEFSKMQQSTSNIIKLLAQNDTFAIYSDRNGKSWLVGSEEGFTLQDTSQTGKRGEQNKYILVFTAQSTELVHEISTEAIATIVVD